MTTLNQRRRHRGRLVLSAAICLTLQYLVAKQAAAALPTTPRWLLSAAAFSVLTPLGLHLTGLLRRDWLENLLGSYGLCGPVTVPVAILLGVVESISHSLLWPLVIVSLPTFGLLTLALVRLNQRAAAIAAAAAAAALPPLAPAPAPTPVQPEAPNHLLAALAGALVGLLMLAAFLPAGALTAFWSGLTGRTASSGAVAIPAGGPAGAGTTPTAPTTAPTTAPSRPGTTSAPPPARGSLPAPSTAPTSPTTGGPPFTGQPRGADTTARSGTASWYYHGGLRSCAAQGFAVGSRIKVTTADPRLSRQRSITCRVTARGPGVSEGLDGLPRIVNLPQGLFPAPLRYGLVKVMVQPAP